MNNRDIEAARAYHEITKHSYTSVRSAPHYLDWDNRPLPYKIYPDAPAIALPRDMGLPRLPALQAISQTPADSGAPLNLEKIARILFCADGLTRRKRVGAEDYHFRAAPSAGALYPIEIYVAASEIDGLAPGLYHFSPADLKLRALREGDFRANLARHAAESEALLTSRAVLILSSIFWRSTWKYRARAYRYCFWDAGTILANLLAATSTERMSCEVVTAFIDAAAEEIIWVDGEREAVMCLAAIGKTDPAEAVAKINGPLEFESAPLSASEVAYDDLLSINRASRLATSDEVTEIAGEKNDNSNRDLKIPLGASLGIGETILRRGSSRSFVREAIAAADLERILGFSSGFAPVDFPPIDELYVIVNAIEGMEPGAYFYDRAERRFELLKAGEFRAEAGYLCLEQTLGADCSALVCYVADLEHALRKLGNRGYRDAHLEAGILGGRAYLAAYSLGYGATGLTFYDDDTTRFFSPHAAGKSPILMVAIGISSFR